MQNETNPSQEQKKPQFLYHASPNTKITTFEPRAQSVRDETEGPKVFATPDHAYATMHMVPVDDSWTQITTFDGVHYIVISDEQRFHDLDKGGAIYSLPSTAFENDPQKSETGREWTSKTAVSPTNKDAYQSGLEAMIANGVRVYFVDRPMFEKIQTAQNCGYDILQTLESENQKREKN